MERMLAQTSSMIRNMYESAPNLQKYPRKKYTQEKLNKLAKARSKKQ